MISSGSSASTGDADPLRGRPHLRRHPAQQEGLRLAHRHDHPGDGPTRSAPTECEGHLEQVRTWKTQRRASLEDELRFCSPSSSSSARRLEAFSPRSTRSTPMLEAERARSSAASSASGAPCALDRSTRSTAPERPIDARFHPYWGSLIKEGRDAPASAIRSRSTPASTPRRSRISARIRRCSTTAAPATACPTSSSFVLARPLARGPSEFTPEAGVNSGARSARPRPRAREKERTGRFISSRGEGPTRPPSRRTFCAARRAKIRRAPRPRAREKKRTGRFISSRGEGPTRPPSRRTFCAARRAKIRRAPR
jgi:hypothetical protein